MEVHRSRFVPYPTPTINAAAFSHSTHHTLESDRNSLRLAVGRANGDIEIWNPLQGGWVQETIFHGGQDRSVEGLAWIQDPDEVGPSGDKIPGQLRLFSIGYASSITEWNLATGLPLRHAEGNGSEPWCLAAQPPWKTWQRDSVAQSGGFQGQSLITGNADGTISLFNTQDDDLVLSKTLGTVIEKKARVLSVTWQSRKIVVAGYADSTIRVFNTSKKGSLVRTISLGAGPKGAPKETLVWTVKCLPNGDIVSGDSLGDVRLYEGKHYSQVQQLSGHAADVLDLAVGGDYNTLFSVGMDRRTIMWKVKNTADKGARLVRHSIQTHHEHDVKTLAVFDSKKLSIIASGGLDPDPVILPFREYTREEHRRLSGLPQNPPLISAPASRLVASWWNREVRIWRILSTDTSQPFEATTELIARIAIKGEANISSASLDRNGRLLAVSTAADVKAFELQPRKVNSKETLRVRKITSLEDAVSDGARLVQWSPDGKWLALVSHTSDVSVLRCAWDTEESRFKIVQKAVLLRRIERDSKSLPALRRNITPYERTITRIQFSDDSTILAAADLAGHMDTWLLEGQENRSSPEVSVIAKKADAQNDMSSDDESEDEDEDHESVVIFGQAWAQNPSGHLLPKCSSSIILISFRPQRPNPSSNSSQPSSSHLFVLTAKHQMLEFDINSGSLTTWSKRNDSSQLPKQFRQLLDRAMGCVWHVTESWTRLWLYGSNWLHMLDLDQDFRNYAEDLNGVVLPTEYDVSNANTQPLGKKRKLFDGSGAGGMNTSHRRQKEVKARKLENGTWENVENRPPRSGEGDIDAALDAALDDDEMDIDLDIPNVEAVSRAPNGSSAHSTDAYPARASPAIDGTLDAEHLEDTSKSLVPATERPTPYFYTHKYRPILGIVPIDPVHDGKEDGGDLARERRAEVEVVLVERPVWDLDLPPRFKGDFDLNSW